MFGDGYQRMAYRARAGQTFRCNILERMRKWLCLLAMLLFAFIVYLPALRYALVYDDLIQIVGNPRLTSWSYVPGYFTQHLWAHLAWANPIYYRPVFLLWLRLVYAVFGTPREIWHLSSIAAHLAATACVFLLLRRLTANFNAAVAGAGLFALYPTQTEAVAWVSSSGDLLLTSFLALCIYFYAVRKEPISWLSILFAALAMFTKEAGIVALALIFAYEWIHSNLKNALTSTAPYGLPALFYLALRVNALGRPISSADPNMSLGTMVLTWPRLLAIYAAHLLWPVHLSVIYDLPLSTVAWPLLLLIAVLGALAWLVRRGDRNLRFGAAWFGIAMLPALAIRYIAPNDYVHDRYLYLPFVGLALMAAAGLSHIRFTPARVAIACVLALALGWQTHENLRIWQDDVALFSRAVEIDPGNVSAKNNLAFAYLNAHRPSDAYPLLVELLKLNVDSVNVTYNMGRCYQEMGNAEGASYYFSLSKQLYGH